MKVVKALSTHVILQIGIFVILSEDHTQLTDIFRWSVTIADQMTRRIFLLL